MSELSEADTLFERGREFYTKEAYEKALESWRSAQELYRTSGRKRDLGIVCSHIARALNALGRKRDALVSSTQAVRLLREVHETVELSIALATMGRVLVALNHFEEAARAFEQATEQLGLLGQLKEQIELLLEAGNALERAGLLKQSSTRYAEAVKQAASLADVTVHTEALAAYAHILQQLEDYSRAEEVFQELVQLSANAGKSVLSAHALLGLASTYISQGRIDDAEAVIHQAQRVFGDEGDVTGEPLVNYHLARILLQRGQLDEALRHSERALQMFTKERAPMGRAQSHLLIGQILVQLNQGKKAIRQYDQAIEILAKLGEQPRIMQARLFKGKVLLRLGRERDAEREFSYAIRYYQEHNQPMNEIRIYLDVANIMNQMGKYGEAQEQCLLAIQQLQNQQNEDGEILAYRLFLEAAQGKGSLKEDLPLVREGLQRAKTQKKMRVASSLSMSLVQLTLDSESPEQTITILEQAVHDEFLPVEQRTEAAVKLGIALMKEERFAEAAQHLGQAIANFVQPSEAKAKAYYQLSEAYRHLKESTLRKDALREALASLPPRADEILQARLQLQLAPLIASEDAEQAIEYYKQTVKVFEVWDYPKERFTALLGGATALVIKKEVQQALKQIELVLILADELDIPLEQLEEASPSFAYLQRATEVGLFVASTYYHVQKERSTIEKMMDWSTRRKVARLLPFLTKELGFERCADLFSLVEEEQRLTHQAADLRKQLAQLPRTNIVQQEFATRRDPLRSQLDTVLAQMNVNRNVILAACAEPGQILPPRDYKVLQKITTLMPAKLRWILINYNVLRHQNRIIVSMIDHIGRHGNYTLPIASDIFSIASQFQSIKETKDLPPPIQLQELGEHLFRSLVPSPLARELQSHSYGYVQIITDDFLHYIPTELFFDGRQYWGLQYAINHAPDLLFFESTLKMQALAPTAKPSMVVGVNTGPEERGIRRRTAEEIAKALLGVAPTTHAISEPIVLFGSDFTRTLLANSTDQPRSLIFLSTPTTMHHRKGEISLQYPDSLRVIELGVSTNFTGAPIVVLDDCVQTEPREDGLNLAAFLRHLIAAGAPSVLYTRWRPDPQLQPHFAAAFARQFYEGSPITVVLQQVRRQIYSLKPPSHNWLAYSLCGNPFPSLF